MRDILIGFTNSWDFLLNRGDAEMCVSVSEVFATKMSRVRTVYYVRGTFCVTVYSRCTAGG